MLRKLLILSVFAGTSASIPVVYQSNPQIFENLLKSTVTANSRRPSNSTAVRWTA
jgi:aspartyl protease family protein